MASTRVTAMDPKPTAERIEQLAQRVLMGDIVLPEFQRPFVWSANKSLSCSTQFIGITRSEVPFFGSRIRNWQANVRLLI
jgi:hypothetical protein